MKRFNYIKDLEGNESYSDWLQQSIEDTVEGYVNRILEKYSKEDIKTVFDIGSMNAMEAYKFTEKFPECITHSFEPFPDNIKIMEVVKDDNKRMNLYELALSDFNGISVFYTTENTGANSLLKPMINNVKTGKFEEICVDVMTGKEFCERMNVSTPDVIWMDVQGNELNVLKGFGEKLNDVKAIYTEAGTNPYYEGHTMRDDIVKYCESFGFELVHEWKHDNYEGDLMFIK